MSQYNEGVHHGGAPGGGGSGTTFDYKKPLLNYCINFLGDVFEYLRSFMHKYRRLMTQQIKYVKLHRNSHNIDTVGINIIEKSTGKSNVKSTAHGQKL